MADNENPNNGTGDEREEPVIRDKRRIDPETGDVRDLSAEGGADAEASAPDPADLPVVGEELSDDDQQLLDEAATDLVAEMRSDMLRAQAELVNFRTRVERDRVANREAVVAEVLRSMLPVLDDFARAEKHGDLVEGAPMTIVAHKLRSVFDKYGVKQVGEKGEAFDPNIHEAVVQLPTPGVTTNEVADVIEPGFVMGERLMRAAKVVVSVPAE